MRQITKIQDPSLIISENEEAHIFFSFCTFVTLIKGKKLSLQNIFLIVLKEVELREMLKQLLDISSNYEIVKLFIEIDPTIIKSKYVTKYMNSDSRKQLCL